MKFNSLNFLIPFRTFLLEVDSLQILWLYYQILLDISQLALLALNPSCKHFLNISYIFHLLWISIFNNTFLWPSAVY